MLYTVKALQSKRKIVAGGAVGASTWAALLTKLELISIKKSEPLVRRDVDQGIYYGGLKNMTDGHRNQIYTMGEQRFGYTAIANRVGLSRESVKGFCRSHDLSGVWAENNAVANTSAEFCASCGKLLVQIPGREKRRFCCKECRVKWWNSHPEQVKKRPCTLNSC